MAEQQVILQDILDDAHKLFPYYSKTTNFDATSDYASTVDGNETMRDAYILGRMDERSKSQIKNIIYERYIKECWQTLAFKNWQKKII